MRAFWVGLVLLSVSLWALFASPNTAHARQAFDIHAFDQAAKLAPAGAPRGLGAKLVQGKTHQAPVPGDHPAPAPVVYQGAAAPAFVTRAAWVSTAVEGPGAQVHHYSATGPPGHRPS